MRLIDADERIRFINMGQVRSPYEKSFSDSEVVDMLEAAPTIDAVEVVRCKDCEFANFDFPDHLEWVYCERHNMYSMADDFCSYGERKETSDEDR